MTPKKDEIEVRKASRANPIVIGALAGAGAGVIAAMLLRRRAKNQDRESMITATEAINWACWCLAYSVR
jgi:hypothetical protein